jgi:hypothetical protein
MLYKSRIKKEIINIIHASCLLCSIFKEEFNFKVRHMRSEFSFKAIGEIIRNLLNYLFARGYVGIP